MLRLPDVLMLLAIGFSLGCVAGWSAVKGAEVGWLEKGLVVR